jgi:hypothetical protein
MFSVIMSLLKVTLISFVLTETAVSPQAGTVLTTDGGMDSTVICWA